MLWPQVETSMLKIMTSKAFKSHNRENVYNTDITPAIKKSIGSGQLFMVLVNTLSNNKHDAVSGEACSELE